MAASSDRNSEPTSFDPLRVNALRSLAQTGATATSIRQHPALLAISLASDQARQAQQMLEAMAAILSKARGQVITAEDRIRKQAAHGYQGGRTGAERESGYIAAAGEMLELGDDNQFSALFDDITACREFLAALLDKTVVDRKKSRAAKWTGPSSEKTAERGIRADWTYALLAAIEGHFARLQDTEVHPRNNAIPTGRPFLPALIEDALDDALTKCQRQRRPFRTADLILALLELPGGYVAMCFNGVRPGLAETVRTWLGQWISEMTIDIGRESSRPSSWADHPDIQYGEALAAKDGAHEINEVYVLLGVLNGRSNARRQLAHYIDVTRLEREAQASRHLPNDRDSPDPTIRWVEGDDVNHDGKENP